MRKLYIILFITSLLFSSCEKPLFYLYKLVTGYGSEAKESKKESIVILEEEIVVAGTVDTASALVKEENIIMCEYCPGFPAEDGSTMCSGCISEEDEMDGMGPDMSDMGSPDNSWDLHKSLKEYETNVFECETDNFRIRVDLLGVIADPGYGYKKEYRYASWRINESHNKEPALVLYSTETSSIEPDHLPNGRIYEFQNGLYTYICTVINGEPGELIVYKADQELRRELFKSDF